MTTVSVIMANYACAAYLPAAIESLKAQTLEDWELILVDDASPDDSVAVAEAAAAGDPRIRIIAARENRGPGGARNAALDAARGEWVAVFDSDDLMAPDRLERLVTIARGSDAAIVADNLLMFSGEGARPFLTAPKTPEWVDLAAFIDSNTLFSRTPDLGYLKPLIRRELIGAERYDESLRIGEDYDLLARLLAKAGRMRLEPAPLYKYRRHAASVSQRMSAADIQGLLGAHARFVRDQAPHDRAVKRALERRRLTLEALLLYDRVIVELKGADKGRGMMRALTNPHIWPLLTRPVKARVRRLMQFRAMARAA